MHRDDDPFRHLHMPRELACEFLAVFSRIEYAIKATPRYAGGDDNRAEALWDRFANDIDGAFDAILNEDGKFKEAVDYLLSHPPRKQVFRYGTLEFKAQILDKRQARAQQTLLMIRTVRNNLFHGGKHYPEGEQAQGRNERLASSSLQVLRRCALLIEEVRERYLR